MIAETGLLRYDIACRGLADARVVDEVKSVLGKAAALRLYGRQAKNKDLELAAAEIRLRAGAAPQRDFNATDRHEGGRPKTGSRPEPARIRKSDFDRVSCRSRWLLCGPRDCQ